MYCTSILPHVLDYTKERSSLRVSLQPLAPCHCGHSQLGPSSRQTTLWDVSTWPFTLKFSYPISISIFTLCLETSSPFLIPICVVWLSVVGSLFVVLGLYAVLWGKGKEENQRGSREEAEEGKEDLELQINGKLYIRSWMRIQLQKLRTNSMLNALISNVCCWVEILKWMRKVAYNLGTIKQWAYYSLHFTKKKKKIKIKIPFRK